MANEESNHHHYIISPSPPFSMRNQTAAAAEESGGYGEIVEVHGGHIMRSTGKKDKHSKVCTAKGARDRRVRLSALTAIHFYDVQDRLGFDRPSKALDWLINKAKSAIDDLAQLPPWNPTDSLRHAAANAKSRKPKTLVSSSPPENVKIRSPPVISGTEHKHRQQQKRRQIGEIPMNSNELSFLPPSLDSDSIADTIKSFFPVGGGCSSSESPPEIIQNYNQPSDLISRHQNLQLSLQSFQNNPPSLLLHHNHRGGAEPVLFSGENNPLELDTSATEWEQSHHNHHQSQEFERIQRFIAWNSGGAAETGGGTAEIGGEAAETGGGSGGGGFVFASPPILNYQSQVFSQRGSLQSINTPLIRAWFDPYHPIIAGDLHNHNHHSYHIPPAIHHSATPGIAFGSSEFSGFRIPARFQEEQNDGITNKPSFASSNSRH